MTDDVKRVRSRIVLTAAAIRGADEKAKQLREELRELIRTAVDLGMPKAQVATLADVSRQYVSQVAPSPEQVEPDTDTAAEPESAPENMGPASGGSQNPPGGHVPGIVPLLGLDPLSGVQSRHASKPFGHRRTAWVDVWMRKLLPEIGAAADIAGDSVGDVLSLAKMAGVTRVFLTGPPPRAEGTAGDAGIRAWFLDELKPWWSVAKAGHHLDNAKTPTARYVHEDGTTIEIMRSAAWWGESDADVTTSRDAWFALQTDVQAAFGGDGTRLLATPATTGRDLWARTIGRNQNYAVLSDEIRELIHATAGQGRIELLPQPLRHKPVGNERWTVEIPGVHVRDGRLMYAALTWGMPVGPPTLLTAEAIRAMPEAQLRKAIMGRSRWHVNVQVPKDWHRPFGLLMAKDTVGPGWCYPAEPGRVFETWCDGSELALAMDEGWRPALLGGITWREGKPLNSWTEKLLGIWTRYEAHPDPELAQLVRRAIRSMILFGIGAFASRGRTTTHTLPEDRSAEVPAGVKVSRAGGMLVWTQPAPATAWARDMAHPEWSAAIWARARVRLLDGPGVNGRTGALYLPPGVDVIAFRTDALVLTGDPGWADDGKPGRLRYDGELIGPFDWPETEADMLRLKTRAQMGNQ